MGAPAVRIPYMDTDGKETAARFRLALQKGPEGDNRFRWRKGDKPSLYGLWRLHEARKAGYVVIVEGESDSHTLWHHGVPAVGVPGADNWSESRDAVRSLPTGAAEGVSVAALAAALKLDKGTVSRRMRAAAEGGFLRNLEERKGKAARWVVGNPLRADVDLLPTVEALRDRCSVAVLHGGGETPPHLLQQMPTPFTSQGVDAHDPLGLRRLQAP